MDIIEKHTDELKQEARGKVNNKQIKLQLWSTKEIHIRGSGFTYKRFWTFWGAKRKFKKLVKKYDLEVIEND